MLWPSTTTRNAEGVMEIGGLRLDELAAEFGTPLYIYDEQTIRDQARRVRNAFTSAYSDARVVYAAKAFGSPAIIQILRDEGLGLDVVSEGELRAGLFAGMPTELMTFHGNNKSRVELIAALQAGVDHIAVDNLEEIAMLGEICREMQTPAHILLRLNPGIDVHTHSKIATGVNDSKFGFPVWDGSAEQALIAATNDPWLEVDGYHLHIGSQLLDWEGYVLAIGVGLAFAGQMKIERGVVPRVFSPGGGFGIAYTKSTTGPDIEGWAVAAADAVRQACNDNDLPLPMLIFEPGRFLVGAAGVALYEVGSRKAIAGVRTYVSVDGGMADNIRPALYDATYTAEIANRAHGPAEEKVTISGRYCESGDILIKDIELPRLRLGDLLAVPGAGAYSMAMASNYNMVPRPAVVLVNEGKAALIRRRETIDDLLALDMLPGIESRI
jgi:diaminopimelate decarboxylase